MSETSEQPTVQSEPSQQPTSNGDDQTKNCDHNQTSHKEEEPHKQEAGQKNLTTLAEETKFALQQVWDELGVPMDEREAKLHELHAEVEKLYKNTVDQQTQRRDKVKEDIDREIHATEAISKKLQEDPMIPNGTEKTLLSHYQAIKERQNELDQKIAERHEKLQQLHATLTGLCKELGEDLPDAYKTIGEVYSQNRIDEFHQCIAAKESEKKKRENSRCQFVSKIRQLWEEMEMKPDGAFQQQILSSSEELPLKLSMLEQLEEVQQELENEKGSRETRLKQLGDSITDLWAKLETPQEEQDEFFENHHGIGNSVLEACQDYLDKLREEFQSKIGDIVANYRDKIRNIWTSMLYSEDQGKKEFPSIESDCFDEELLEEHERYVETLEKKYEELSPILKGVEKRDALLQDKQEYERIIADPNRLLSRGGGTARLREEKLEKRVRKELPAVTKRLVERITEWERNNEKSFYIRGRRYLDVIEEETAEEEDKRASKKHRPSTITNGGKSIRSRTVGSTNPSARSRSSSKTRSNSTVGKPQAKRAPLVPSSANTSTDSANADLVTPGVAKQKPDQRTNSNQEKMTPASKENDSVRISNAAKSSASKMLEAIGQ